MFVMSFSTKIWIELVSKPRNPTRTSHVLTEQVATRNVITLDDLQFSLHRVLVRSIRLQIGDRLTCGWSEAHQAGDSGDEPGRVRRKLRRDEPRLREPCNRSNDGRTPTRATRLLTAQPNIRFR